MATKPLTPFQKEFAKQRAALGPGQTFMWNGGSYTTDYAEEADARKKKKQQDDEAAAAADAAQKEKDNAAAAAASGQAGTAPGNYQIDNNAQPAPDIASTNASVRLALAKLHPGGASSSASASNTDIQVNYVTQTGNRKQKAPEDWRVKVSLAPKSELFYKSSNPGIMASLIQTQGAIFPYTPDVSITHTARYAESKLTHSNYAAYFYEGSEVAAITIKGDFTVQTVDEGQYLLAVITFFRSCTKMFFGTQAQALAGSPPPMVFLSGYGKFYLPNVPCVLTSFQHTMPADCDYIDVVESSSQLNPSGVVPQGSMWKSQSALFSTAITRVPVMSSVSISLQPVYSRKAIHENFNLEKFASGELLSTKGGFI